MKSARRGQSILQNVLAGVGTSTLSDEAFEHLASLHGHEDVDAFFVTVALGQHSYISLANRMLTEPGLADTLGLWRGNSEAAALVFPLRCGFEITAKIARATVISQPCWQIRVCPLPKRPARCWKRIWR